MRPTLQVGRKIEIGKIISPHRVDAVGGNKGSKRLHITDKLSRLTFLVDTGSDVSIIPYVGKTDLHSSDLTLFAANNTRISTYGSRKICLDLGLRREIKWEFCVADVPYPIIGADLLEHYGLYVDLRGRRLIDSITNLFVNGTIKHVGICNVSTIDHTSNYAKILKEFPEITSLQQSIDLKKCKTVHHIITNGPPIAQRARRLDPEKLKSTKEQFREMTQSGICRPSSAAWASPILLKHKKDGSWRICGDYRRVNSVTEPDKFPVPYLQDFTSNLHGKKNLLQIGPL